MVLAATTGEIQHQTEDRRPCGSGNVPEQGVHRHDVAGLPAPGTGYGSGGQAGRVCVFYDPDSSRIYGGGWIHKG